MNQPRSKILKGLVALFGFIAICIILLAFPGTNQENSFINFSVSDLKKDNVSELIVDTKAVDLALNDPTARIVKDIPQNNKKVISFESSNFLSEFSKVGPRPFIINSSRHLIRLALCNGIRNAIEATKSIEGLNQRDMPPIVVAWGETDSEYWISVLSAHDMRMKYGISPAFNAIRAYPCASVVIQFL